MGSTPTGTTIFTKLHKEMKSYLKELENWDDISLVDRYADLSTAKTRGNLSEDNATLCVQIKGEILRRMRDDLKSTMMS